MGDGDDFQRLAFYPINNGVRVALENQAAGVAAAGFANFRVGFQEGQCLFEIVEKAGSDALACFLEIPVESTPNFSLSRRV